MHGLRPTQAETMMYERLIRAASALRRLVRPPLPPTPGRALSLTFPPPRPQSEAGRGRTLCSRSRARPGHPAGWRGGGTNSRASASASGGAATPGRGPRSGSGTESGRIHLAAAAGQLLPVASAQPEGQCLCRCPRPAQPAVHGFSDSRSMKALDSRSGAGSRPQRDDSVGSWRPAARLGIPCSACSHLFER